MPPATEPAQAGLVSTKETWKPSKLPRKIKQLQFGLMSGTEAVNTAEFHVHNRVLYTPERLPAPDGLLDTRLGVSRKGSKCETCGQTMDDCTGHFGYIKLELPVFHIGYFKTMMKTLQCICKTCSKVLLLPDDRQRFLKRFRAEKERMRRVAAFAAVTAKCKLQRQCPHCGDLNGPVRKVAGSLKLVHEKFQKTDEYSRFLDEFKDVAAHNSQIHDVHTKKAGDDLNPVRVQALFCKVPDEDCELLDLAGRPEDLLMTIIPVPPVCIRPSVEVDGGAGSNEDDVTLKLNRVIEANNTIRNCLEKGSMTGAINEAWDFIQIQCAVFINSDAPGIISPHLVNPGKPIKGFVQRLKGKQGRFRGNLSGKRVNFTGRTVISPDPNLRVDQVAVPKQVAMILTYPERVTQHNIERLQQCVKNGVSTWPGAKIINYLNGSSTHLRFGDRMRSAAELRFGDVVERHLTDGDIVLFNRQPSLHRMSIMAHKVRVMPWRTLRFNECVCSPYNADFDGDEMNLHVPQTEEARTEALHLMGVMDNLCTPKNGEILIAATQDFLTSAYLMTSKDRFYTRADIGRLCAFMGDAVLEVQLPHPALVKPLELWTGKQVFSLLVRPNANTRVFVNLETKEKIYKGGDHMCPMDGFVCFHNSLLICGRLGKATLGGGNKAGLFQVLTTDFSARAASAVMNRLAKLSARFIGEQGFSIGIDDVTPALELQIKKQKTIDESYAECDDLIEQFKENKLPLSAGCDMEGSLEAKVTGVLNNIRESASKVCMSTLHWHNSPLIMSQCGSKGSPINIAQMVACVGQQVVSGSRAPNGFKDRSLPHFPRGDKTPAGKGFVANSFFSGLSPTEFFFHTMAGREGLVDTAVKTAETGYMSRRLMKALEDLYTHYDGTVRNAANTIVQLEYGDDGMDPVCMEGRSGEPVALPRAMSVVKAMTPKAHAADLAPLPARLQAVVAVEIERMAGMQAASGAAAFCTAAFEDELMGYLQKQIKEWEDLRGHLGLPLDKRGDDKAETAASMLALSEAQVKNFVQLCAKRYDSKRMDPGSTVGAFGAQSIGEPGTQMTLKTFHFAGVAAMNVTLGVPRIREIINASKKISTPIISVALEVDNNETYARLVKARLERTSVGQVAKSMSIVLEGSEAYIRIALDYKAMSGLQLDIQPHTVAAALVAARKLKLKPQNIATNQVGGVVEVTPSADEKTRVPLLFQLQALVKQLPDVIVQGIPTVERAIVNKNKDRYELLVEGTDLRRVMGTLGVVGARTTTNHVLEAASCLGIEAARVTIMKEIKFTMGQHGMAIDDRHTMLLADSMTFKGEVLGITRFGIAKMKDSVLNLASFEKTTDHLFDAALHGRVDEITGVSESIIMGIPMPAGTGLFKLRQAANVDLPPQRPSPILSF